MSINRVKALEATLDAAVKVLEIADDVLETTPIPGAAAVIKIILDVVKQKGRADRNAELTDRARQDCEDLVNEMAKYMTTTEIPLPDAPSELQLTTQALARQLQGYARELKEATTHRRPRLMTCQSDEEALQDFVDKTSKSIARYHFAQGNRVEEYVGKIRDKIEDIDTKVDRIGGVLQGEHDDRRIKEWNRLIEKLPRAELAPYNADRKVGTLSSCSEGTRTTLLEDVADWITDPEADRLYWLKERAGFGKTAVALSVAERAAENGMLAASFFYSYQVPDLSHASFIITTIVYQLSFFGGAPYKRSLAVAIEEHSDILRAKLKDQIRPFFLDPLKDTEFAPPNKPILIVIDGLDECQREEAEELISIFISAVLSVNLPLKVFITSRPEVHLIAAFSKLGVTPRSIDDTSNKDVETYLRRELATIPSKPGMEALPEDWITPEDIHALLVRSGVQRSDSVPEGTEKGLFVYVATVTRFISDPYACDPQGRLRVVLSATPPSRYRPYQGLDALYTRVMDVALQGQEDLVERFRVVMGGIVGMNDKGLPITAFEKLLDLPPGEVRRTLTNLQSVIQYPETDSNLPSFHHRSFTDFLISKDRSGPQYYINVQLHHKHLALRCLLTITASPLKEAVTNAMNQEDYFFYPRPELSPQFRHATRCLPDYFASNEGDKDLLEEIEKFIKDDFGWWIELLPYGGFHEGIGGNFHRISDAVDPKDEKELPVVFRALHSYAKFYFVDRFTRAPAIARKELRRYISVVTQETDVGARLRAQAMTRSIKTHIRELGEGLQVLSDGGRVVRPRGELIGPRGWERICAATSAFAEEVEAAVDKYQLSMGNKVEVARSRKHTIYLRQQLDQVKPTLSEFAFRIVGYTASSWPGARFLS